jgi:hypothetical protein
LETPYLWFNTDMTFSWIKHDRAVPLVTTAPRTGAPPGNLDDPNATVLFNGKDLHDEPFLGGRFQFGGWLDECQFWGLEGAYFFVGAQDKDFAASASGVPGTNGLFVPFFNALTGQEDSFVVASPGATSGSVRINTRTALQGTDGHFLFSAWRTGTYRVDGFVGYRWLELDEDITIQEDVRQFTRQQFNDVPQIGILDHFGTRNDFIGGEMGLKSHHILGDCWSLDFIGRVALGSTHQIIQNDGFTGFKFPGLPPIVQPTGNFVGPLNIGTFTHDTLSVVPEFGMTVGWQARTWLRFTLGYNILFWSDVVRPGDQIDRVVNPIGVQSRNEFNTGLLIPARPMVLSQQTDFWAQSVALGMQFTW